MKTTKIQEDFKEIWKLSVSVVQLAEDIFTPKNVFIPEK
jgi:hypothetical protein